MSATSSSKTSWLRAALLAPLVIVAMLPVAGESGHVYVALDAISAGEAFWLMAAMHVFFMCGIFLYVAGLLILYMLLIVSGSDVWRAKTRRRAVWLLLAMAGGFILNYAVNRIVRAEIAATPLATETIRPGNWSVGICGKRSAICLSVEGSLGRASLKDYIGGAQATLEAFGAWEAAARANAEITVEWGRTPAGWNAARSAGSANLELRNDWI